jgi:hypothetical protein
MDLNAMYESNPERTREAYKWGQLLADNVELKEQLYQLRAAAAGSAGAGAAGKSDRISGLSKQQLDERLRGGLCLRCGSSDHYKNDCPRAQ